MFLKLTIEYWAISRLIPYQRALRKNNQAVKRMVAQLREFGLRLPLLIMGAGTLIAGDLRLKAAKELGLEEVPVIVCDDLTPAQVKALRLSIDRSSAWSTWDLGLVALEMGELKLMNFDMSLTGFEPR